MIIQPIQPNSPSFGYSHPLKTLFKKGQLPVKKGFYGGRLTQKNVTLEHLLPVSKGGKTQIDNLVLATKETNNQRGDKPINEFFNLKAMADYLEQFKNIRIGEFDGNKYIKMILETIGEIL